jgi:hypothetical protein
MTRDERGQLAGIEALPFGVLVFVIGILVVANAWAVVDAKLAAAAAAREAARAFVEASDSSAGDARAQDAAADALAGYSRDPDRMTVTHEGGAYGRCQRVTFHVEYRVTLGAVPIINRPALTFTTAARHSELVDPYRNGLPGEAHCVE